MATFSSLWTENQTLHSSSTVASAGSASDNLDLAAAGYYLADVQIDLNANTGSPNGNVTIEVFGSPNSGTKIDTIPRQTITVPFTAQAQKIVSLTVGGAFAQVKVTNGIGENLTYIALYAGLQESSA